MMASYFGDQYNPDSPPIWAEIQWTGWLIDGGLPLMLAAAAGMLVALREAFRATRVEDSRVTSPLGLVRYPSRLQRGVVALSIQRGVRSRAPSGSTSGFSTLRFLRLSVRRNELPRELRYRRDDLCGVRRFGRRERAPIRHCRRRPGAGGGMDAPNFALASYLARAGGVVHVVAYRVAEELRSAAERSRPPSAQSPYRPMLSGGPPGLGGPRASRRWWLAAEGMSW